MNIKWRKNISNFHIFIAGIFLLKIILMGIFSSDYQNKLFMKFIYGFLERLFSGELINPYERFSQEAALFPYPPGMFVIECFGGALSFLAKGSLFWANVLFKLPNLFFDCLGMYFLVSLFPGKRRYVAVLYFASPIIVYSSYMHGQLDIIPTTLLMGALLYLTSSRKQDDKKYIVLLALSMLCKFHILAVLPILFLFIAKRCEWRKAVILTALPMLIVALCIIPFWGDGFLNNVLLNNEQSVLAKVYIDIIGIRIYVPILAVVLIYLNMFTIGKINRDLLYSLCGILFSVFLTLVPPMPGWYVWIVPFITIFFIHIKSYKNLNLGLYTMLNMVYLLYFFIAHRTSYVDLYYFEKSMMWMKTDNSLIINGLFTVLEAVLLYTIYMMYESGVASNSLYKRKNMPFTIGIAGDSGSGKSTFISMVETVFGKKNLLFIEGDGDHKWERGNAMWKHFTHLNPKSNYLYRQAQDLAALKSGQSVLRADYDHDTGKFTKKNKIKPKPYILLCGLHALYLPQVRNNLDLKVYMDIDENLRRYWKIQRDISERGYSKEAILGQIADRIPDAEKYIYPQRKYADLVVSYFDKDLRDCTEDNHVVNLNLKLTVDIEINLETLIQKVEHYGIHVEYDYDEDLKTQSVVFESRNLMDIRLPVADIAVETVPHLDEILNHPLAAADNLAGILEIVLLLLIENKLRGGDLHD